MSIFLYKKVPGRTTNTVLLIKHITIQIITLIQAMSTSIYGVRCQWIQSYKFPPSCATKQTTKTVHFIQSLEKPTAYNGTTIVNPSICFPHHKYIKNKVERSKMNSVSSVVEIHQNKHQFQRNIYRQQWQPEDVIWRHCHWKIFILLMLAVCKAWIINTTAEQESQFIATLFCCHSLRSFPSKPIKAIM